MTGNAQHPSVGHVVPLRLLVGVLSALLVLTWITVAATYVDLGPLNLWLALAIATVKAALVALYFMHLRWDRPINGVVFLVSIALLMLFVGLALMDTEAYKPDVIEGFAPDIQR